MEGQIVCVELMPNMFTADYEEKVLRVGGES